MRRSVLLVLALCLVCWHGQLALDWGFAVGCLVGALVQWDVSRWMERTRITSHA
jgi:hypothetical protein